MSGAATSYASSRPVMPAAATPQGYTPTCPFARSESRGHHGQTVIDPAYNAIGAAFDFARALTRAGSVLK